MTNSRICEIDKKAVIPFDCDIDHIIKYFHAF